ncbi:MAG: hypothetical protein HW390_1628 [Candidatus Brocadiaceae bacterium]|nr:hypothetical protein [Candidatus Brocadiaceae bacterium]
MAKGSKAGTLADKNVWNHGTPGAASGRNQKMKFVLL